MCVYLVFIYISRTKTSCVGDLVNEANFYIELNMDLPVVELAAEATTVNGKEEQEAEESMMEDKMALVKSEITSETETDEVKKVEVGKMKVPTVSSLSLEEMSMLERLCKNPNVVAKSQQRGEPDLSPEEKLETLKAVYSSFPVQFLTKFGSYLQLGDSNCFDKLREEGNYEVLFHLSELEKLWRKGTQEKRLKNRRYEALKKLVETTDYFSEEEMQRRNPILYDQLIGRYHTEEERAAFLQQSYKSTSGSGTTSMPLTDLFLAHLERSSDGGISCRRMAQESQQEEEDEADAEYDSEDDDYDMESSQQSGSSRRQIGGPKRKPTVNDDESQREEIEDDEKELFKEEFFTTMYRSFLNGKDEDFDYSTVDDNLDYDCGEDLDNDEEEKYFEDEEPCQVSEPSSDQDDLFKPPVRSAEIESKIEQLTVNSKAGIQSQGTLDVPDTMSYDEDELDAYVKQIEKQLSS